MDRGRLEAFSDGVFAVAITLLALNLAVGGPGHGPLLQQLGQHWPTFIAYLISFFTIGIIWVNHHALTTNIRVVNRTLLFLNLLLLLFVPGSGSEPACWCTWWQPAWRSSTRRRRWPSSDWWPFITSSIQGGGCSQSRVRSLIGELSNPHCPPEPVDLCSLRRRRDPLPPSLPARGGRDLVQTSCPPATRRGRFRGLRLRRWPGMSSS